MVNEIKIITEAIEQMSGQALWAFIVYLIIVKVFVTCVIAGVVITVVVITKKCIMHGITHCSTKSIPGRASCIVIAIRDALKIGCPGTLVDSELTEIESKLPEITQTLNEKNDA